MSAACETSGPAPPPPLKVLLVDDDEDQYVLTRDLLSGDASGVFDVDWAASVDQGVRLLESGRYDVALVDYRMGEHTGLDLLASETVRRAGVPAIMLTGAGDERVDGEAMAAGAVDYLVKQEVTAPVLKRALRYAVEGHRVLANLQRHEGSLRALLADSTDVILLVDVAGAILFASDSVEHVEGCRSRDLLGTTLTQGVHDDDAGRVREALAAAARNTRATVTYRQQHRDGSWRHREATIVNRLTEAAVEALVVTYRDVTERARATARQAQLAGIVEASADAIFSRTIDGVIQTWNAGAERLFGYTADEAIGIPVSALPGPASQHVLPWLQSEIQAGRSVSEHEVECRRRDGRCFPALLTISPMRDGEGRVKGAATIIHDISERRRMETALLESEEEYRTTFDEAPIGIAHATLDGRVLRANARLLAMFRAGSVPEQAIDFEAFTHPDDRAAGRDVDRRLYAGEILRHAAERRLLRHDGTYFWARVTVSVRRAADGTPRYFIVIVEDISEQRESSVELSHLFNLSPDMIAAFDYEGRFLHVNAAWTRVLGYADDDLHGRPFMPLVHPEDQPATAAELQRLTEGETTFDFTNRYRRHDGSYRWMEWHAKADTASRVIYAVARDQTDRHSLEQQLRQAQKMEAVGRLAGGVAHDFNNLLTAIMGFSEMTLEQLASDDPRAADLQQVMKAAHTAATLTGQLLAFSRKQILEPRLLDLNTVVEDTRALLRRLIGEDVVLETRLHDGPCPISADRGQLQQVIMNLAVNARDAMPDGGTLTIATGLVEHDPAFIANHPGAAAGPHVLLRIADTGTGMSPDVLTHVFDPFFTTKEPGKGTGLGLSTVYGIVKQSGGYVTVESDPGAGTRFDISLPIATALPDAEADTAPTPAPAQCDETILVVEDQPEVRDVVRRTLSAQGYRVLEADGGPAALALLQHYDGPLHLLFTDVVMPLMSGADVARAIGRSRQGLKVLYTSGYTDEAIVRDGVLEPGIDLLRKPFSQASLLAKVREALDRPPHER